MSDDDDFIEIENCAVQIVQYIDGQGDMSYRVSKRGNVPVSTFVGLMEIAKHIFLSDHRSDTE